jgi:hypothetical protein
MPSLTEALLARMAASISIPKNSRLSSSAIVHYERRTIQPGLASLTV